MLNAPWYMILIAKIFGKKSTGIDYYGHQETVCTGYTFRGVTYITKIEVIK